MKLKVKKAPGLDEIIDERIGEVRTESIDISFGEIINLHTDKEFIIQPEYQRLFRWSPEQCSRLVESVLLELQIPQIFVIENDDGVFELIDGLQRISSMIKFIDATKIEQKPLKLTGCELIPELDGTLFEDLSLRLKLRLKRSTVRMIVIKRQSKSKLRYEMFKRLNTGGSLLSSQEIRNCTSRMAGQPGIVFYRFLQELASNEDFRNCTSTLSSNEKDQRGDEELVLRFLALKNARNEFSGNVRDWLDKYMDGLVLETIHLDYAKEKQHFNHLFTYINNILGSGAFVRYNNNNQPVGALAPAYFEAITMGLWETQNLWSLISPDKAKEVIIKTVQSTKFRDNTGPAANTKPKLTGRIDEIRIAIESLQ